MQSHFNLIMHLLCYNADTMLSSLLFSLMEQNTLPETGVYVLMSNLFGSPQSHV